MKSSLPFYALIVVALLTGCSPNAESPSGTADVSKTSADSPVRQRTEADKDAAVAPETGGGRAAPAQTVAPVAPPPLPMRAEANRR